METWFNNIRSFYYYYFSDKRPYLVKKQFGKDKDWINSKDGIESDGPGKEVYASV